MAGQPHIYRLFRLEDDAVSQGKGIEFFDEALKLFFNRQDQVLISLKMVWYGFVNVPDSIYQLWTKELTQSLNITLGY